MELHQLRCFEMIADELHFARAAERLGTTQSGVSRTISALEAALGTRLFNRSKRSSVTLTSSGALFLPEARLILRQAERGEAVGKRAGRGEIGCIEIGYVASAALGGTVSDYVRRYRATAPGVDVHLRELETPRQIEEIAAGRLDAGFIRARTHYPVEIRAIPLQRDALLIALHEDHPLARQEALRPTDLAGVNFLIPYFGEAAGFLARLQELGIAGGFTPRIMEPVRDFLTVLTAVAAGLGFGLVPASVGNLRLPGTLLRPVAGLDLTADLVLAVRHAEASPVVLQFLAQVLRNMR
ncbi:MAG: hypothetical protein B7X08_00085 [Acidocella sp. 20-63-7]|nr:MAG: hypothetical protein B7X08_00085 [Acidocella sp. 20-63-7]HQT46074.1 LysR substrate-binding domain-containing protein [Acidocella sp.]